jgi:hypothetical protein
VIKYHKVLQKALLPESAEDEFGQKREQKQKQKNKYLECKFMPKGAPASGPAAI